VACGVLSGLASLGCMRRFPAEASRLGVEQAASLVSPARLGYRNQVPQRSLVPHRDTPAGSGRAESPSQGPPGDVSTLCCAGGTKGAAPQAPTCNAARRKHCRKLHGRLGADPGGARRPEGSAFDAVRRRARGGGSEGPAEKGRDQRGREMPRTLHSRGKNKTLPSKTECGRRTRGGRRERSPHAGPAVPHMASPCGGRDREDMLEASSRRGGFCSPSGTRGVAALQEWLDRTGEAITRRPRGSTRYAWYVIAARAVINGVGSTLARL
jgi:hypothetical protein